jgi:hypothetical protein
MMVAAKIIGTSACGFDNFLNSGPLVPSVFHGDILFLSSFFSTGNLFAFAARASLRELHLLSCNKRNFKNDIVTETHPHR